MRISIYFFLFITFSFCNQKKNIVKLENEQTNDEINFQCFTENGVHNATVKYYNPNTRKRSTYNNMRVETKNCFVTIIYFDNGGRLDNSHITPTKILKGEAEVIDNRGYHYTVYLKN